LPITIGVLLHPATLLDEPELGLFYGIPVAVGGVLYALSRRGDNRLPLE
jgi:hypothetical protein